jgi:membrane-associated protease RseP (regulator of RpoE activity)
MYDQADNHPLEWKNPISIWEALKHGALFLLTFVSVTIAGMLWQQETDLVHFAVGIPYSLSVLFILSCHEFGHYFAARAHQIKATLPYYIPFPPLSYVGFGTLGAVIRTREPIRSRIALFDIGVAGPLAGFVASVIVLAVGFLTLPDKSFMLRMHADFDFATRMSASATPGNVLTFGSPLLYTMMSQVLPSAGAFVPPMWEMYHYPLLITGWFGLLITSLNLLPAGQLDGGHIFFAMFGKAHRVAARTTLVVLALLGLIGFFPLFAVYFNAFHLVESLMAAIPGFSAIFWPGWLFWALMILFIIKVDHPHVEDFAPLDRKRRILGWAAWLIFLLCLTPAPMFLG